MQNYHCAACQDHRKSKIRPPGWKVAPDQRLYCQKCWAKRYILRAVTIPVAGPVDGTWQELRESLRTCFRATTRLSNWAVSELAKADVVRTTEMERLPKMPHVYLYPGARSLVPEIDTGSTVAILHAVERRYRARRYDVVWLAKQSTPNYRYDRAVYPIRSQDWRAQRGADNEALVNLRLAGRRWTLRLRGGHQFRRQLRSHAQLVDQLAIAAELTLYEQSTGTNDNRPGTNRRNGGGQRVPKRLMCKLVAWLPRSAAVERSGALYVRTSSDALLVALNVKEERLWIYHADHVRRWVAEHQRRVNRWADDQKAEQRPTAAYQGRREASATKYRRRMDAICHEVSAQLVNYADRRRFAEIHYDDSDQTYCDRLPWSKLRQLIAEKADARGIKFGDDSENLDN